MTCCAARDEVGKVDGDKRIIGAALVLHLRRKFTDDFRKLRACRLREVRRERKTGRASLGRPDLVISCGKTAHILSNRFELARRCGTIEHGQGEPFHFICERLGGDINIRDKSKQRSNFQTQKVDPLRDLDLTKNRPSKLISTSGHALRTRNDSVGIAG